MQAENYKYLIGTIIYAVKPVISKKVPEIDKALSECGFFVIVTSQKMEAVEALNA